ncbi:GNAT family N-acetyltransferase [Levilactobacillus spicheri]|uniref:GCN5 family N-acetyltransferase n=2 Tax=Levilactobacillus spicheri TaxID=216463 RepID=A0ABQ0WQD0_9LACO|nr:GNAT family N-acetyltransferase [Levilactobacillus spicheri]KRL50671.1 N-acetyltransferase GCN5 [Levilactobacillus spicheri DSM 15429]GEO66800.1 GCN5 family N-acetyltransferase [Levilactobacillus spicheri]
MIHYQAKRFDQLTTHELWALYHLRTAVFVVEQACYYQEVDEADLTAVHLLGTDEAGHLVAYARLIPEHDHVRIGRVVVAPAARGKGAGQQLVHEAIAAVKTQFPHAVQIDIQAQAYLQKFYTGYGFQPVSDVYLETGIPHLDMILPLTA